MVIKVRLHKIRINKQGYDSLDNYWGIGLPLYHYQYETPNGEEYNDQFRAIDRVEAERVVSTWVKNRFPTDEVTFFRTNDSIKKAKDKEKEKKNVVMMPCKECGQLVIWNSLYGDWCSTCKPRN